MSSAVFILDVDGDDTMPMLSAPVRNVFVPTVAPEPGALAHWVFATGGSDGLKDMISDSVLTPQAETHRWTDKSLILRNAEGNGMLTAFDDRADVLAFATLRKGPANGVVAGTADATSTAAGQGWALQFLSTSGGTMYSRQRGNPASYAASTSWSAIPAGTVLLAMSHVGTRTSLGDQGATVAIGGGSRTTTGQSANTPNVSTRKIALGNAYWSGLGASEDLEVFEFGLIDSTFLTAEKAGQMFARAKARMQALGVALYGA